MSGKYSENMLEKKEIVQKYEKMRNKKDRKRPELQIYRPGMGLQNKSIPKPDEPINSSRSNSLTIQHDSSSNESSNSPVDKDTTFRSTASLKTKGQPLSNRMWGEKATEPAKRGAQNSSKNRRPDIQVYVPKPKAIAKLNELSKSRSSSEISECHISASVHKSEKNFDWYEKNESVFVSKCKDGRTHSPEVKVSNSTQETKEKLLHKGRKNKMSVCENIANSFKMQEVRKQESLNSCANFSDSLQVSDMAYRKRDLSHGKKNICGDKETETKYTVPKSGGMRYERGSSSPEVPSNDLSQLSSHNTDSSCKSNKNERKRRTEEKKLKNTDTRRGVKSGDSPKNKTILESGVTSGKTSCADTNTFCAKTSEKREFEKYKVHNSNHSHKTYQDHGDYPQPVQKSLSSECLPDERTKGGGILRLPRESLTSGVPLDRPVSVLTEQTLYEPLVIVQQKHLYNPDNPDVPEIVSVPTHMNGPCSPSGHVDYFCAELSPGSVGYIPPPQPSSVARQYSYEVEDFPSLSSVSSRNLNVTYSPRSMLSPVQCSIPSPTPSPIRLPAVIPSPTLPFLGSRQEIIPSPAPRLPCVYNNQLGLQDTGKKRIKPIVEKNLLDISVLERQLSNYLAEGLLNADQKELGQCRWKLQLRYENIILADPRYCAEKNVEQSLWKSVYHQIIESLRKTIEDQSHRKEELTQILLNVVHEGTVFYENLLEKQQETFGFNLSHLLEVELLGTNYLPESVRLVLISCQKILIYLGDLARYKEQANETTNYGKARSWYLKAQQIAPKNGRPYNQLAIVALHTRRKLDAVYYYMRSLAASNPFLSARESLLSLFDDAKKKFEHFERKRTGDSSSERENSSKINYRGERCEIWIKPDGSKSQQTTQLVKSGDELEDLSSIELNKRFVVSFLHVHGKLFTKVGMETFVDAVKQMLKEFHHLLQRTPLTMRSSRLLQLMAVNMFAVENTTLKDMSPNSLLQEHAVNVTLAMVSLIMERCCTMYEDHLESPEYPSHLVSDDLAQLLPAVKVWTDWMSCQRDLWKPPFVQNKEFGIGCEKDVWFSFAKLLTTLRKIDTTSYEIALNKMEGYEPLVLEEDASLSGFVPLLGAAIEPAYVKTPFEKNNAKNSIRVSRVQFFGDYLCGISTPYLEFDVEHKKFISLVDVPDDENSKHTEKLWEKSKDDAGVDDDEDKVVVSVSNSEDVPAENEIQMLWSRKEALHKAREQQEHYKAQVQVNDSQKLCSRKGATRKAFIQLQNYSSDPLISEIQELYYKKEALLEILSCQQHEKALCQAVLENNQNQHPVVLQIQPKYLVPDTNCFIDHLQIIKDISKMSDFIFVVPLVVINELDGLAHGTRVNPHISPEHANKVTMLSREAVTFLENEFSSRNPQFQAITSKGSVLDTISFRNEDMSDNKLGTNDDLILSCCLYYCKDTTRYPSPRNSDGAVHVFREAVLLTDDRNLRVKALTHNVPARNLVSFLSWVKS